MYFVILYYIILIKYKTNILVINFKSKMKVYKKEFPAATASMIALTSFSADECFNSDP